MCEREKKRFFRIYKRTLSYSKMLFGSDVNKIDILMSICNINIKLNYNKLNY